MYLFICLFALLLLYFYIENRINQSCLASFKAVIHVNGIRGKTSTCRYLDAVLRSQFRVFTKTTGTDAMILDVGGNEIPCRRLGPANIHEQIRIIRRARREGAEILILECMAVRPELQKIAQEQIVKSSITVITNVRYDHIFEMGDTLEEIAASLSSTIPENGTLYTADSNAALLLSEPCRKKNCRLVSCPSLGTSVENIELARMISRELGITEENFVSHLPNVKTDFGARKLYPVKNKDGEFFYFLNLFSANDPQSTSNNVKDVCAGRSKICFLYNHREDRPDRALLFARYFFPDYKDCTVYISGRGAALPRRLFAQAGVRDLRILSDSQVLSMENLDAGTVLVGIGNIKGVGYKLIKALEERGNTYE